MAPAVIAVLALSVYPLFRGIYLSFLNYNLVRPNDPTFNTFAGLQNYIDIFKDKVFLQSIWKYSKVDSGESCGTACGSHASCTCTEPETERKICIQNPDSGSMGSSPMP